MCGRIVQATSPEEIAREFGADLSVALRESLSTPAPGDTSLIRAGWHPRWNMAPSSRSHPEVGTINRAQGSFVQFLRIK
jgi:hypothetical protein